ncbi:MAG: PKD domain-containing protein, partial [Acidobacteria bacterium]|nr:PKD domain-containing protein [Acidobacteriota bacterium]
MKNVPSPFRPVTVFLSLIPSARAVRDLTLIALAWSMLTPTLALAGAVGAKSAGLGRSSGSAARARGGALAGPPSTAPATPKKMTDDSSGGSGTDFWLMSPARGQGGAVSVLLAGDSNAEGTVSNARADFEQKFQISQGRAVSVEVPVAVEDDSKGEAGVALHVTATSPVSAVVLSRGGEGATAYAGLPSDALGTEYIAVGRVASEGVGHARLFVLAVSDSTTVTINPTVPADGHRAGESYSVMLDRGAVYQLAEDSKEGGDPTGTVVSSDKAVAVFVGYEDASVRPGGGRGAGWFAQLPPTDAWGKSFVASPSGEFGGRVRVVASADATHVRVDGADVATIDRSRSYEQAVGAHSLVTSDKPVLVAESDAEFDSSGQAEAAPLVLITPSERYAKTYTFATPSEGFDRQRLNVVIAAGGTASGLTLDGAPVSPTAYASIGEGRFSVATVDVRGGAHTLAAPTPFGVTAYGSGSQSRYAYSFVANLAAAHARGKEGVAQNTLNATAQTTTSAANDCGDLTAIVRHAPSVNGRIEGSVQMLTGEYVNLNSGNVITSDLLVPGTPSIQINGTPGYQGTVDGTGTTTPTGYGVTINSGAQVRHVVRRTNPVTLTSVPVPPASTGTRSVTINSPGQSAGTWSTVRDLTLNSGVGAVTVPAGTYNNFTANDGSYLVFGVAGATTPAVYNFDTLTLNSNSALRLVGPVQLNVGSRVNVSSGAVMGYDQNPRWMELNVSRYDVTVNSLGTLYGVVRAPSGTVYINGRLRGSVQSDRLSINSGASLEWMGCAAPTNQAPTVSADSNQTITLPNNATLNGTASDDGLPSGSSLTVTWSKLSGPGSVTFANANAAATTVSFTTAGTYVLRLTASDTQLTSTSDVTVTVNAQNRAPVVNAGPDLTIAMPNAATLAGTATDDGLPSGSTLTSTWSVLSGPGAVTFANSHAASTTATFAAGGTYVLRLTASDTQLSASDDVTVTVDPRNTAPSVNAGADQSIELPNNASLNASVTDDGYPRGSTLTYSWGKAAGPAAVSFANAGALATTVSFGAPGTYTLRLTASDTEFNVSDDVVVTVYPQNQAPTANAGQDKTVSIATGATLDGVVTDDGLPHGSTLTSTWSKLSGPGDVTFADASRPSTTASFSAPGVYTLRLTANDTRLAASDDIVVTVIPVNRPPTVNAGTDASAYLGANLLRNAGAEEALVVGKIPFWTPDDGLTWAQGSPGTFGMPFGVEGATYFYPNALLDSGLRQDVDVSGFAPLVDAGAQSFEIKGYVRSPAGLPTDGSRMVVEYRDALGAVLSSFDSGVVTSVNAWAEVSDARVAPAGTRVVRVRLLSVKANAQVGGGLFDHLSLRAAGAAAVHLNGTASDDGNPAGSALAVAWGKVSGPGEVRFANPAAAATSAVFTEPGTYVLSLTANDSELNAADGVTITVGRANLPPVVNAGADGAATVGLAYNLNGAVTDDGLPEGSVLTHVWAKASGPGAVTFGEANALATTATFDQPGEYVLRLTAGDSEYSISGEVRATVEPANAAPEVNAGADQTIYLPADAGLNGSVSDDGLPRGASLALTWTKVSGPGPVNFADAHAAQTSALFSAPGTYVLRLSAGDTQLTGQDELNVSVVAANQPPSVSAGNAQIITMPTNSANLAGAVTDDGLPAGARLTSQWSVVGARAVTAPTGFADDFNDNSLDTARWQVFDAFNGAQIVEQNQRLEFRPSTVTNSGVVIRTVGYRDLRDHTIVFKYGGHVGSRNPLTRVVVRDDVSTATVWMDIAPTSLQCYGDFYLDGFSRGDGTFAYDGSPFWVRFRQEGNSYKWETSPDGVNWEPRVSASFPRSPTQYQYFKTSFNTSEGQPVIYLDDFAVTSPAWDKYAGPGSVTFADASSPATTATFSDAGVYTLRLMASDTEFTRSTDVTVTVNPSNHAPVVEAGTSQTILLTESAKLNGSASDEGLPLGAPVALEWSKVSGPGNVTFADPANGITTATFSSAGYYVLRLSAGDTQLTGTDDVLVKVVETYAGLPGGVFITGHDADDHSQGGGYPALGAQNIIKRAVEYVTYKKARPRLLLVTDLRNPGGDQADPRNAMGLCGFTVYDVADYGSGQQNAKNLHTVNFSDYDVIIVASDFGGWLRQDELDILNARSAELLDYVNSGGGIVAFAESGGRPVPPGTYTGTTHDRFKFLPFVVSSEEFHEAETGIRVTPDGAAMGLTDSDVSGNFSHNIFTTTGGMSVIDRDPFNNFLSLAVRGKHITSAGADGNDAPIVSAGQGRAITLPHATTLAGFVSDDGLPAGSAVTTLWRKISGPGNVNISSPNTPQTEANFDAPGVYVLRFSASDGQLSSYSDVTVTANPLGQYVVVGVGSDQTIRLTKSASLNATVTDGRVSQTQPLTLQWTKVSGPGAVTFANPATLSTAASFGAPGVYVLRFSAGDPTYAGFDELTVSVRPAAGPLADDFNDNTNDPSKWYYGPGITEAGGQLQATLPNVAAFPEFQSVGTIDMTGEGAFVQMEVVDYGDPNFNNSQRYIFWRIQASEGHWFQWVYNSDGIDLYLDNIRLGRIFGHPRYWRLIHFVANDRVNFQTSDDNANWVTQYSLVGPYTFTLDSLIFRLIPGANGTNAAGTVKFDNVNSNLPQVLPNRPPTPATGGPYHATVGVPLQLDGSGSTDPGDVIVDYVWDFGDGSAGSGATPTHTYSSTGTYVARLTVRDIDGATGTTTTTVTVTLPNQAPTVNAGADQTMRLPASATLGGSVSDDGLPEAAALTSQWSIVSGPGSVNFANASNLSTTASFSTDGTYVLRLTASDSELSASDDVIVTVEAAPQNQPPTASAGEDQSATPGLNLVRNGGGEEQIVNGVIPGWTKAEGESWAQSPAGTSNFYESFEGKTYLHAPGDAHAELQQDVDVSAYAGTIKTGAQQFAMNVAVRAANETPADTARVVYEFRDASDENVLATADSGEITTSEAWQTVEGAFAAPAGTAFIRVRLIASRNSGATTDAYFDAVSVRALTFAGVKLTGTVTDDGLPTNSTTARWSVVSGPGTVLFADEHAASTAASFAAPGDYVLRLTADDTAATVADDVTVNVTEANRAPAVNAGVDQTITLPNTTTALVGSITDEGLPRGRSVSARWSKVAGPGAVTFTDASSASTDVSFAEAGVYVLRLTAGDTDMSSQDDMVVTVKRAPVNQAPVVEAGPDQSVSLPGRASLTGQAVDDGRPSGSTLTYTWSKLSGPGSVSFSAPSALMTDASFSAEGVYVLRLTASDSELSASDELTVTVSPRGTNSAPNVTAGPDQEVRRPDAVTLYGNATDDGLPAGSTLSVAWSVASGPGPVSFTNARAARTDATFDAAGTYVLRLTASDSELTSTDDVSVTVYDAPTGDAPTVELVSPADGAEVTAPAEVIGSVSGGAWRLEYAYVEDESAPPQNWRAFATGSGAVTNGLLGRFDPTVLLNGSYAVRLSATDTAGRTSSESVSVVVARQMKVGNFTVSFNDLSVPVAGIPIQVTRTYDSRDKRQGDFGVGWTLSIASARVQKTVPVGSHWFETQSFAAFRTYCLESTKPQIITVTFGDGKVYKFKAEPAQKCQRFQPFNTVQMVYTPMPGTRGTLTPLNGGSVIVAGSVPGPVDIVDVNDPSGYYLNPSRFRLTVEDGTSFVLGQKSGVESVTIPSGESLTITSDGITHSSGESVSFIRDAQGRIQEMRDPAGRSRFYTYDANGDLSAYKDAEGNTTTFAYAAGHYLTGMEVRSADGTSVFKPITNEYVDGRLVRQLDADLKEIKYEHDTASRREVITDRLGHPTTYEYDEHGNVVYTKDAEGGETRRTYDERDNVLTETTAEGTTTNVYDPATDDLLRTTDQYGNVTKYTYNALHRVTSVTDPLEHVTTSEYDEQSGLIQRTVDGEGNQTLYHYKTLTSSVETVTVVPKEDPAHGRTTNYRYYNDGRLLSETDPENRRTEYTYDDNGNRATQAVTRTRSDGTTERLVIAFRYDGENRLVKTIYP